MPTINQLIKKPRTKPLVRNKDFVLQTVLKVHIFWAKSDQKSRCRRGGGD